MLLRPLNGFKTPPIPSSKPSFSSSIPTTISPATPTPEPPPLLASQLSNPGQCCIPKLPSVLFINL
jgi:hypothetical protein